MYKVLATIFLGIVVGVFVLGLVVTNNTSLVASPLTQFFQKQQTASQEGVLGAVQGFVLRGLGVNDLQESTPSSKLIEQAQEIQEKTAEFIESIQGLPEGEFKEVKGTLRENVCEKLLGED